MSYDFSVFAVVPPAFDELIRLVRSTAGLDVDGSPSMDAESLVVVRGARRTYCFTIDGPFTVEPEDVPEEVTASVIGAQAVYQVLVEGSKEASIPHAVKFARKLAKAGSGAMVDEQSGDVWPKPKGKRIATPSGKKVTDCVRVVFYYLNDDSPSDLLQIFLRLARKYLPEALPRRFGQHHPLEGKLDRDGDQGFIDTFASASMFGAEFVSTYPVGGGFYDTNAEHLVGKLWLSLDNAVLSDPKWRDALRSFFIAFATESRSFFASAEVLRDHKLGPSGFGMSADSELRTPGAIDGIWMGLQPYPHWWTWIGPDYVRLVSSYLTGHREMHGDHLFHSWSEEPLNRDQLTALLPDPTRPWIPIDFQAMPDLRGFPDQIARIIPQRLRQV